MKLENLFKGLEFVGALVAATSIANLSDDKLEELKTQLGLLEDKQEQKKEHEHYEDKKEDKKEKSHDLSQYSNEEKAIIENFLKSLQEKSDNN